MKGLSRFDRVTHCTIFDCGLKKSASFLGIGSASHIQENLNVRHIKLHLSRVLIYSQKGSPLDFLERNLPFFTVDFVGGDHAIENGKSKQVLWGVAASRPPKLWRDRGREGRQSPSLSAPVSRNALRGRSFHLKFHRKLDHPNAPLILLGIQNGRELMQELMALKI
jgi:hypothetical protein